MRILTLLLVCLTLAGLLAAQAPSPGPAVAVPIPNNFAGVQLGLTPTSHVTGGLNWGHQTAGSLWTFTRVDVVGFSRNPAQALTAFTAGACDIPHALFSGRLLLGWCADLGISETSTAGVTHVGNALGTDGLALWRFTKKQNLGIGVMGGWMQTNLTPANAKGANSAITPVRVILEYGFN